MRSLGMTCLVAAVVMTIAQLLLYPSSLPRVVASNFGVDGTANSWMPKRTFLTLHVGSQVAMAAFLLLLARYSRFLPEPMLNMPHKEYWLNDSRRQATFDYNEGLLTLIAGITAIFLAGVFQLVFLANLDGTQQLRLLWFIPWLASYLLCVLLLVVGAIRRFASIPQGMGADSHG